MSERKHRRRRFLIDSFQYRFLGITLLYFGAVVAILATAIFLPLIVDLQRTGPPDPAVSTAATEFLTLHARFWPALGVTFILVALHAVITSHRIAGPLYRFRATYREIAEGDLAGSVRLRKNDYLGKDARALNAMIGALRERLSAIQDQHGGAVAALHELGDAIESGQAERAREALGHLKDEMHHLEERLDRFHLDDPGSVGAGASEGGRPRSTGAMDGDPDG